MTRCGWLLIVVFLVTGCGKYGQLGTWPARVVSTRDFSSTQQTMLASAIKDFNDRMGQDLLVIDTSSAAVASDIREDHFYVSISRVPFSEKYRTRLGYTRAWTDHCEIEISEPVFLPAKIDMFAPVVWHELGHCVGFDHEAHSGEVMSATAAPLGSYTPESLKRFFQMFLEAVRLG